MEERFVLIAAQVTFLIQKTEVKGIVSYMLFPHTFFSDDFAS